MRLNMIVAVYGRNATVIRTVLLKFVAVCPFIDGHETLISERKFGIFSIMSHVMPRSQCSAVTESIQIDTHYI